MLSSPMLMHIGTLLDHTFQCVMYSKDSWQSVLSLEGEFDFFLINRKLDTALKDLKLLEAIALRASDWVEVIGLEAEALHDAIDLASVRQGRQNAVGDGIPMTAWHDEIIEDSETASYVLTGGLGYLESKVVMITGTVEEELRVLEELKRQLSQKQ